VRLRPPATFGILLALGAIALGACGGSDDSGTATGSSTEVTTAQATGSAQAEQRLVLPDPLPDRSVTVPILMYHRIAKVREGEPQLTIDLTVDPDDFARQMQWLADNGFTSITQRELYDALMEDGPLPERPVLITFDDGYRGVATVAAPIMRRHGFIGTAYVITDRIAKDPKVAPTWLTWGQLRALDRRGWDIGSHTVSHADLTDLPPDRALKQLRQSRFALERNLDQPVQWFCYPYGRVDAGVEQLVREAGYVLAVTTQPGDRLSAREPLLLPRVRVAYDTGVRGLAASLG